MEQDSWLQLPVPMLNDTDFGESVSEISSVMRWAEINSQTSIAPQTPNRESQVPVPIKDHEPQPSTAKFSQPSFDGAPLEPGHVLNALQKNVAAPKSHLDSILPVVPMADLSRIRACLSSLAVAYRQQELSGLHLQAELLHARQENSRLAREVDLQAQLLSEANERAGFLSHTLQTIPEGRDLLSDTGLGESSTEPATSLSLSLAVLRGTALQRAAERISALSAAISVARAENSALCERSSDTSAVTAAGYVAAREQLSRLSAEIAQQAIIADIKIKNATQSAAEAQHTAECARAESAAALASRNATSEELQSTKAQLDSLSLAAQRFRESANAGTERLALAEEAIGTLQGMLVEQDTTLAAQAMELQALHNASREGSTSRRVAVLTALSSSSMHSPSVGAQKSRSSSAAVLSQVGLNAHSALHASAVQRSAAALSSSSDIDILTSKVDWLGHHIEHLMQQQHVATEHRQSEEVHSSHVSRGGNESEKVHNGNSPSSILFPRVPSRIVSDSLNNLPTGTYTSGLLDVNLAQLDPDYVLRVESREQALRANYDSQVTIAVEAARLEVISRLQGIRSAGVDNLSMQQLGEHQRSSKAPAISGNHGLQRSVDMLGGASSSILDTTVHAALAAAAELQQSKEFIGDASVDNSSVRVPQNQRPATDRYWGSFDIDTTNVSLHSQGSPRDVYSIEMNDEDASVGVQNLKQAMVLPAGANFFLPANSGSLNLEIGASGGLRVGSADVAEVEADESESWIYVLPTSYDRI